MYNTNLFEEEEYQQCKRKMDERVFTRLMDICNTDIDDGIPLPLLNIIYVVEDMAHWGKFCARISSGFKGEYLSHPGYYGDLYLVLAYTIYGYGNWSNNDRIRKGLKPIRFKQLATKSEHE